MHVWNRLLACLGLLAASALPLPGATADYVPPKALQRPGPVYPQGFGKLGIEGMVVVAYLVGTDGRVQGTMTTAYTNSILLASAVTAVEKWRFQPATRGGVPVAVAFQSPVLFITDPKSTLYDFADELLRLQPLVDGFFRNLAQKHLAGSALPVAQVNRNRRVWFKIALAQDQLRVDLQGAAPPSADDERMRDYLQKVLMAHPPAAPILAFLHNYPAFFLSTSGLQFNVPATTKTP